MTTFSDNGREPPFSVVLWPLDCQNLAVAKNHINSENSLGVHTKFEMDCMNTFSDNGRKPQFSSHFVGTTGPKFGQYGSKANQFWTFTQSVYTAHLNWIAWILFQNNGRKPQFSSHFVGTTGPKFGQHGSKANQFWTFTQSVYTARLNWIAWILFQIMVWNHHFQSFYGQQSKSGQLGRKSILNTHQINVHTKFELDCVNTFWDNVGEPSFSVILWAIESQNLANVAKKQIISEHLPNKCTHQVRIKLHEYFFR